MKNNVTVDREILTHFPGWGSCAGCRGATQKPDGSVWFVRLGTDGRDHLDEVIPPAAWAGSQLMELMFLAAKAAGFDHHGWAKHLASAGKMGTTEAMVGSAVGGWSRRMIAAAPGWMSRSDREALILA